MASEIERIGGYDDACILEDLPTSTGRFGPYKFTMAAAAALCLIEAEGVTLFNHDGTAGLVDEQDFDVEMLLPSGRMYALERTAESEALRPRKVHDKTCRVRFHLNIPPRLGARNSMERDSAMTRLQIMIKRHFSGFGVDNIGFFKARDARTGRYPSTLTGFVNHPKTISRKEFITTAFKDITGSACARRNWHGARATRSVYGWYGACRRG